MEFRGHRLASEEGLRAAPQSSGCTGPVLPSALSLRIPGPFFSGKQATFITSDSQALMQSRWSHELQMHCREEVAPSGPPEGGLGPGALPAEGH